MNNYILENKYYLKRGNFNFFGNKIISKGKYNIIIYKEINITSSINFYTDIIPNIFGDCGLIFGFENYKDYIDDYFLFLINKEGYTSLFRRKKKILKKLFPDNDCIHQNYNKENIYRLSIRYNFSSNVITTYVNGIENFKIIDFNFVNSKIGLLSSDNGTIFTQILPEKI